MNDDILGGSTLPIVRGTESGHWSDLSFSVKTASILGLFLLTCVAFTHAWEYFLKWQENAYRLSMRRRHGIPDTDHRPFNVAYAAVTRARQVREAKERTMEQLPKPDQRTSALANAQNIRQRFSDAGPRKMVGAWSSLTTVHYEDVAESSAARNYPTPSPTDPLNFTDRYNPNPPSMRKLDPEPQPGPSKLTRPSRRSSRGLDAAQEDRRKRFLDDEDDLEPVKKTRVEHEELVDGDEGAEWQQPSDSRNASGADGRPKRGSKRGLGEEDYENFESKRTRDKRARKVLRDRTPEDQIMGETDGDEPTELITISRGRKRDRAEAGSTFGGDDGELAFEGEDGDDGKNNRRRKRRSVMKRKSDVHSRGQKRDRAQSQDSDSEEDENRVKKRISRKSKGKINAKEEAGSDVSMGDSQISQDPLCKGRHIGEEWEAYGVQWKVGLNGDRLRQALIKKARSKFVMPKDSQHPDREANLEVFIESWLTEDQYKEARDRHELAWQDSPKASVEPETPGNVPDSPSKSGKNLLWSSTVKKDTPKRGAFRQSIATNLGIRINPFEQPQPGRRVVSSYGSPVFVTNEAINASGNSKHRAFSKWEKQDLEAQAMAKMRAKAQEEKIKQAATAAPEVRKSDDSRGANATVPTLTFTAPAGSASFSTPVEKPASTLTFGVSPVTTNGIKATEPAKPTTVQSEAPPTFKLPTDMSGAPKSLFSLPVASNTANIPPSIPSAPNVTPAASSGSFSFGAQPKAQQPTNNASSSLSVPGGVATRSSSPASAPSQPVLVNQDTASKPSFVFTPPSGGGPSRQFPLGNKAPNSVFGKQNEPTEKPEQKSGDSGAGMSIFAGLNGYQSSQTAASASTHSGGGNNSIQPTGIFQFGQTPTQSSGSGSFQVKSAPTGNAFTGFTPPAAGAPTTPQSTPPVTNAPAASGTGTPSTIKFHFGVSAPPNPILTASSSTLSGALDSSFAFGSSTPKPTTEMTGTSTPKLNPPTPSNLTFGPTNSMEGGKNVAPSGVFGAFGGGGMFSTASSGASFGSVFGGSGMTPVRSSLPSTTNATFSNPSASASGNNGGTEAHKFVFPLAKPAEPSNTSGQQTTPETSTVGALNNPTPTPSAFGFTSTPGTGFTFGQQTTPETSTVGAPNNSFAPAPTPSAFGFTSTPGTGFTFGQQQQ